MSYQITILKDDEFDSLPYDEAPISLGLADTNTGKAYVRYTESSRLNKYLIEHELEHLTGEDRDDVHKGEDGVYYKGFGNIFSGIGQSLSGAGSSLVGAGRSIGSGLSSLFGGGGGSPMSIGGGRSTYGARNIPQGFPSPSSGGGFLSSLFSGGGQGGSVARGLGTSLLGQFIGPRTPRVPDVNQLSSFKRLGNVSFRNFQEMDPQLTQAINSDYDRMDDREKRDLLFRYKGLRPGADVESDSSFRRDLFELQRTQGERRGNQLARNRFDFISKQLQMSQGELAQAAAMADLEVDQIAVQLGIDFDSARRFKEIFERTGENMITSGLGMNKMTENIGQNRMFQGFR